MRRCGGEGASNLVEALRGRGVKVEYMIKHDEGHGFVNPDNVIDMYKTSTASSPNISVMEGNRERRK